MSEVVLNEQDIALDQELLGEIAQRYVAPKKQTIDSKLTDALSSRDDTGLADVLNWSSAYEVKALDRTQWTRGIVQLREKKTGKTFELHIATIEEAVWQTLLTDRTPQEEDILRQLKARYKGNFSM